jgi:hypothetical protein
MSVATGLPAGAAPERSAVARLLSVNGACRAPPRHDARRSGSYRARAVSFNNPLHLTATRAVAASRLAAETRLAIRKLSAERRAREPPLNSDSTIT